MPIGERFRAWVHRRRSRRRARQCRAIRAGALRHGLDLAEVPDDRIEAACRVMRRDAEMIGDGPTATTAELARALRIVGPGKGQGGA